MKKCYLLLLFISLFAASYPANAQITITPGGTAATLMNKLLGPGVVGLSPVLTCPAVSNGTFTAVTSPLIFDSGIVLTTGQAATGGGFFGAAGPASNFASSDNGAPGDPMLSALSGGTSHNACILEFDFRPIGDTVKFDYIFGSEEYPGYTCSPYNDPFGFFISGPGYGSPMNIALIPGTAIPVCINSLNCGATGGWPLSTCTAMGPGSPFCAYYINNSAGSIITYDGISTKMTAIAAVTPCDTYHLKLGIADVSDDYYDSGVFLKAGSLTSTAISIASSGMNPNDTIAGSQFCVRGCLPGRFIFQRGGSLINPLTIHYLITGTAVNGYDYTTIPDSVTIAANDSDEVVLIHGLTPPTGTRTVKLLILAPYTCGGSPVILDSAVMTIKDSFYVDILTADTAICNGQYVHILATGDSALTYSWSPAATLSSSTILDPIATPTTTTTYVLTGQYPAVGCNPSHASITITVYYPPGLAVGAPVQTTCQGVPLQLSVDATPAGVPYTYSWTPSTYLNSATIKNPIFTPADSVDRLQSVTVSPPVPGCSTTASFWLHVLPNDFALYNLDTGICFPPSSYQIRLLGDTEFTYKWEPELGVSDPHSMQPIISPLTTTIYTVTASYGNCPDIHHTVLYSIKHPQVDIATRDTTVCLRTPLQFNVQATPVDSPYTFSWTPVANLLDGGTTLAPSFFTTVSGNYEYVVRVESLTDGCFGTDTIDINVAPPVKITINPGNTIIPYGSEIQLNAIQLTTDELMYRWTPEDGSLTNPNISNPVAKPLETTHYVVYASNIWGCIDTAGVTISVDMDMNEFIPTAFTPNGDGLNDLFRIRGIKYQRIVDFRIFNRWGQLVYNYHTGDPQGWDGTFNGVPQDMGVYNYSIILQRPEAPEKIYKGNVTLVR